MTSAWIIVLLIVAWMASRLMRSTKLWWLFVIAILSGLLVGMLGKEVSKSSNSELTSATQLISTPISMDIDCTQFVATVTEGPTVGHSEIVSNNHVPVLLKGVIVSSHTTNGRDSPEIEDDS